MSSQKRLLFKLPLDKKCVVISDPFAPSSASFLIHVDETDLCFADVTGRQLRLLRNNVESVLWVTSTRFLIVDSLTHDFHFCKLVPADTTSERGQLITTQQFAFQFIASILLEFGVKFTQKDALKLLRVTADGLLDLFIKDEYFIRLLIDFRSRNVEVALSLRFEKDVRLITVAELNAVISCKTKKLRLISTKENDFIAHLSLSKAFPWNFGLFADYIFSISRDFCWLLIFTSEFRLYEIYLPAFQSQPWDVLHASKNYSTSPSVRMEEDSAVETRRGAPRINFLWDRETADISSRSYVKQNFATNGWIFGDTLNEIGKENHVRITQISTNFADLAMEICCAHCTKTESYVTAKVVQTGATLLGTKTHLSSEIIWMIFPTECLVVFPQTTSYPVTLYYPMSAVVIAANSVSGFQKDIAEAAAPDPWEDLAEKQIMEIAINENIVDKAVDYLQKRYPEDQRLFSSDYPLTAARIIGQEYLVARDFMDAEKTAALVGLDILDEIRTQFLTTHDPVFRAYLRDQMVSRDVFLDADSADYNFLQVYEAHLPETATIEYIHSWATEERGRRLLEAAVMTKDVVLVDSFSAELLWNTLTTNDDVDRISAWIKNEADYTARPVSADFRELVSSLPTEVQQDVCNEFARQNIFSKSELNDWQQYVTRIISAFGMEHPFLDKNNRDRLAALPENLRKDFLDFCVANKMTAVILEFIDEPEFRQYVKETADTLPDWLDLILQFHAADMSDTKQVTSLISANAKFCFGIDVTIEKLLERDELDVALSLLCLYQDEWPPKDRLYDGSDSVATSDLLRRKLIKFPKLKDALFPAQISAEERLSNSVTVYRLLQNNAPYDVRKLFGWQSTNVLNQNHRIAEMPSFSNPDLQKKFGYHKSLDYSYYLKNARPSFAYWSFVSSLTKDNHRDELMAGRDMAFFLAIFFFTDNAIVASCVVFLEMLGIESLSTRINIEAARRIRRYFDKRNQGDSVNLIRDVFIDLYKYGAEFAGSVIDDLVAATDFVVASASLYPSSWEASSFWTLVNQFCELFQLPLSTHYLQQCAENNEWLHFLTFCELFQYPLPIVQPIVEYFPHPHLKENLGLIFQIMKSGKKDLSKGDHAQNSNRTNRMNLYSRIGVLAASDKTTSASSDDELTGSSSIANNLERGENAGDGLLTVLTNAQKSLHPWKDLIGYSLELNTPLYALIASSEPGVHQLTCLCVILYVALRGDDKTIFRMEGKLPGSLRDFRWTKHHLESLSDIHLKRRTLRSVAIAWKLVTSTVCMGFQFIEIAADIEERESPKTINAKLRHLADILLRTGSAAADKHPRADDIENSKWTIEFGLKVWSTLMARLKGDNEVEWRRTLTLVRESNVMKYVETYSDVPEIASLGADVSSLSKAVQFDASKILELKSLLCQFQTSSIWAIEEFRMEVWRSIYHRIHVELQERRSTEEVMDMLSAAASASTSAAEKDMLYTILWKLDDSEQRFADAWLAKVEYGLSSPVVLEEWMDDALLGAGPPQADLQKQLLDLGKMTLAEFNPVNTSLVPNSPQETITSGMIAHLIRQGNLCLSARLSTMLNCLHGDLDAICTALALAKNVLRIESIPNWIVKILHQTPTRKMSLTRTTSAELEDETVTWLRGMSNICTLGREVVMAIIDNYCFAKLLQVGFDDMLHFSTSHILELLFTIPTPERLALARRCLVSFKAPTAEVTTFIADYVSEILRNGLQQPQCDVRALGDSTKPFLGVAVDLHAMGNYLIEMAAAASLSVPPNTPVKSGVNGDVVRRDFRLSVELLIAAHEVLTMAGTLEALSRLISACKSVAKAAASHGEFASVLRILNGIGRYSELNFIFNLIKEADQMELLFGRGVLKDPKLKTAILNYLRKFHPDDSDTFGMLAAAYLMHREIGETFFEIAQDRLELFKHRPVVDGQETQSELKKIIQYLMDAASNFSRADCHLRTEKCIEQARLVALQIVFLPTSLRLLSLNNPTGFIASHPRFAEAYIYAQAYGIMDEWGDAVYQNYVINGDIRYLQDFCIKYPVSVALVSEISQLYQADNNKPPTASIYMKKLLRQISDIEVAFKLANELGLNDLAMEFLQVDDGAFLRDVMKI